MNNKADPAHAMPIDRDVPITMDGRWRDPLR